MIKIRNGVILVVAAILLALIRIFLIQGINKIELQFTGEWIVFSCGLHDSRELYLIRPDGSELTRLTYNNFADSYSSISPDGMSLIFVREKVNPVSLLSDNDAEILRMNLVDGSTEQITMNDHRDLFPTWSPDGTQIAFVSDRGRRSFNPLDLYVMEVSSGNLKQATTDYDASHPTWFSSGEYIIFVSRDTDLFKLNIDTREIEFLTHAQVIREPELSPDDKRILLTYSEASFTPSIAVFDMQTREIQLLPVPTASTGATWSPSGNQIAFSHRGEIHIYDFETEGLFQITTMGCGAGTLQWITFEDFSSQMP